jgi:aminomethyltransferase
LANLTRIVAASFDEPGWDYGTSRGPWSEVLCRDGKMHRAVFDDLPLYDKEKKIPRGQETTIPVRKPGT